MAAPENVNHNQFKDHKEVISGIEGAHGVQLTPQGISYGKGQFAPASNVFASESSGLDESIGHLTVQLPNEDPEVMNTLTLFGPGDRTKYEGHHTGQKGLESHTGDSDYRTGIEHSGVRTDENHLYPSTEDSISGKERSFSAHQYAYHEDVPSAMEHLRMSSKERADHLAAGTMPRVVPDPESLPLSSLGGLWTGHNRSTPAAEYARTRLTPPTHIIYRASSRGSMYKVDTGTRERIPE